MKLLVVGIAAIPVKHSNFCQRILDPSIPPDGVQEPVQGRAEAGLERSARARGGRPESRPGEGLSAGR